MIKNGVYKSKVTVTNPDGSVRKLAVITRSQNITTALVDTANLVKGMLKKSGIKGKYTLHVTDCWRVVQNVQTG